MRPVLLAILACATPGAASAHAFLDRAEPAVGGTVHGSPPRLALHFTEAVEPAFSRVAVQDASGASMGAGDARPDPADSSVLDLPLRRLPPGRYRVTWQAVSVDTHRTQGGFGFTVAP